MWQISASSATIIFVLTTRDMELKIGQKAFHLSFVDISGWVGGEQAKH